MSGPGLPGPDDVVAFWQAAGPDKWYRKDEAFDRELRARFGALHREAGRGAMDGWAKTPEGAVALLIALDQFSRNLFRGLPETFAQDAKAREVARRALDAGFDRRIDGPLRQFFYLPFMHSEAIADQERCVALCHSLPDPGSLPYARDHARIIRRFGRFPHRNAVLGRYTGPAEQAFLDGGGFSG